MKKIFYVLMFVLAYTVSYSQTTVTPTGSSHQYAGISSDLGVVINELSDLTEDYKVLISTQGWESSTMPEVINYFEGKDNLNVIDMVMDEDNETLLISLLTIPGVNDGWDYTEWSNHLATIK